MKRIFVEKKSHFDIESKTIIKNLNENLNLDIKNLRYLKFYDVENASDSEIKYLENHILSEKNIDIVFDKIEILTSFFAKELLPAQFDLRAESAMQCLQIKFPDSKANIYSAEIFIFDSVLSSETLLRIKKYMINKIESREKKLDVFGKKMIDENNTENSLIKFNELNIDELQKFLISKGLAMNIADLVLIQDHYKQKEKRNPTLSEIIVLDTYWSDHCRHTTFETEIQSIDIEPQPLEDEIKNALSKLNKDRLVLRPQSPFTLMNLATINAKKLRFEGKNLDVEISEEINACSIFKDIEVDGHVVKYLIQLKNETHNHPTEIEPFGGASTCLGGAIRDPLSGRAFVYQGMRISASGNPLENISDTLKGKLPQRYISQESAHGFSSYGNQIGIATAFVQEFIHPGYKAKHLETGAVVGAVPAENVKRKKPQEGDVILLIGGKTGKDGIGGATGSSKNLELDSIDTSSSEVQKGNALEGRKLQRLFSKKEFAQVIKKSNDFGAGGASVAIGELADSLEIWLDKIPLKYIGLSPLDIAISESQERMAIVISEEHVDKVKNLSKDENLMATIVGKVTNDNRVIMKWKESIIVDLDRNLLNTNGVRQNTQAIIEAQKIFTRSIKGRTVFEKMKSNLIDLNFASQKGLQEIFDSTIGATTILSPYGGKNQLSKSFVSVQKIHLKGNGYTDDVSILASGFNPYILEASPYIGSSYAIIESIAKIVSAGGSFNDIKFSFQEYFEKLTNEKKWGKPLAALIGAYQTLSKFGFAAIGGKDSMSGTFDNINVPPTFISFALSFSKSKNITSPELKPQDKNIYILKHNAFENGIPNIELLKNNFSLLEKIILEDKTTTVQPVLEGGIAGALFNMSVGNSIGMKIDTKYDLFDYDYGTIIIASPFEISNLEKIGQVISEPKLIINNEEMILADLVSNWESVYQDIFPIAKNEDHYDISLNHDDIRVNKAFKINKQEIRVLIPVFPGTNCEYDLTSKFVKEGAKVKQFVLLNFEPQFITDSLEKLAHEINQSDILVFAGGFSAGDEPDGSGKYIANILQNDKIKKAISELRERKGLILGICNGFQALIKSGLLPYGEIRMLKDSDPTLFRNSENKHISRYVETEVSASWSPWLNSFKVGQKHNIPISHGEGRFCINNEGFKALRKRGQIAFSYVDNVNGSDYSIEGITSEDGLILGKMGHSERFDIDITKNILGCKDQNIFKNAIKYFKGDTNE